MKRGYNVKNNTYLVHIYFHPFQALIFAYLYIVLSESCLLYIIDNIQKGPYLKKKES